MRRTCSISMVLLLLILAVVPAWSAPALPDCCMRAEKASPRTEASHEHEHCAGMSMAAQDFAPKHSHNDSSPAISTVQANCRCAMATGGGVVAPLPNASNQGLLHSAKTATLFHNPEFITRLNARDHSERGPPAFLQNQS